MQEQDAIARLAAADPVREVDLADVRSDPVASALLRSVLAEPRPIARRFPVIRRHHHRRRLVSIGVTGAVAAAVLIAVHDATPPPEPTFIATGSAHTVLLSAAARAEHAVAQGNYWTAQGEITELIHRDHDGNAYTVQVTHPTKTDYDRKTGGLNTTHYLGDAIKVQPLNPADAAAYRRDGSPGSDENPDEGLSVDTGQQGPASTDQLIFEGKVSELPSDPVEMGEAMLDWVAGKGGWLSKLGLTSSRPEHPEAWLFREGTKELSAFARPDQPSERAKLYRMLAVIPGVRVLEGDRDPLDRPAVSLALTETTKKFGTVEWQLYIDSSSDLLLATKAVVVKPGKDNAFLAPGAVQYSEIVRSAGWSNKP
ncbi:MAG TPA: hypothetical protein VLL08_21195 [Kineosporiaceae bacterium]|nr:hypothetical protein [Kineosporiaceae bacterium]